MWAIGYWLDGFLPIWSEFSDRSILPFDVSVVISPILVFKKGTLVEYLRKVSYWRWTTVK